MSNKTKYDYNEDNFVQVGEQLNELTVTITLEEYRNLIKEQGYSDNAIEKLQTENEGLKEHIRVLETTIASIERKESGEADE